MLYENYVYGFLYSMAARVSQTGTNYITWSSTKIQYMSLKLGHINIGSCLPGSPACAKNKTNMLVNLNYMTIVTK